MAEGVSHAAPSAPRAAASFALDALLYSYAQIFFARSRWVGALLLGATALAPRVFAGGVLGVVTAVLVALVLGLNRDAVRSGLLSYNALLVGLACSALLAPHPLTWSLAIIGALGSVLATAALHSALGQTFNLPPLSLPFLFVTHLVVGAAPLFGVGPVLPASAALFELPLPAALTAYLQSLGAIFFLPRVDSGIVVLLALLAFSRIGVLLSALAFAIAQLWSTQLLVGAEAAMPMLLGFNAVLVGVALGGVWFVPSSASLLFAAVGVLLSGLITLGAYPVLARSGIPLLILPFNLTVIGLLYAMRQRAHDGHPKTVDFLPGSPEQNLSYYRGRVARFGSHYAVRFSAPFLSRWTCTQGVDGEHTHKGIWRDALDFEVADADGELHRGGGKRLQDYFCYRLPVAATADGTVVKIVDGVPDNAIGKVNLQDNWGNVVILYHAPGVYSMVAHLAPGTIKVHDGQLVRRGDALGLCGSSGRSPRPHLHFQLQATGRLGAPTIAAELHDVVREQAAPTLHGTLVPEVGDIVRNIEPTDELAHLLQFSQEGPIVFQVEMGGRRFRETLEAEIDLYGNWTLRSPARRTLLYYEPTAALFTVYDVLGPRHSVLQLLRAALPRVPLEPNEKLRWADYLPARQGRAPALRLLGDFIAPFVDGRGSELIYRLRREGADIAIEGESTDRDQAGVPRWSTRALLRNGEGLQWVEVRARGKLARAVRQNEDHGDTAEPAPADG